MKRYNLVLIVFLILSSILLFNNKTIKKEIKENNIKALDQEGDNYRLVLSADNVQVPVPKGYVASNVTGENYVTPKYQHTTITHKGNYTQLNWSSPTGETYPWTQDENGIWISGNQGIPDSESVLESEEFNYIKGSILTVNYTYSSQSGDYLNIELINLTNNLITKIVSNKFGNTSASFNYTTSNYTWTMNDWESGRYKIKAIYSKNESTDGGQDSGYIKTSTYLKEDVNGTQTFQEDIKTRIHDGGFVIYQLKDEELETDTNGTSVIINDTNKDEAQSERNQYVWVPVENIEDIVITKSENNGIMQFGQVYLFSNTSITKNNNFHDEPRLIEQHDKTKYYLQRYSDFSERESYLNNMQEEYNRMIKSVNKYKGFYIGRYETGDDDLHFASNSFFINPKVVRFNFNIKYVSWYDSYKDLKRLSGKTGEYVETGMIYESLWDYTLKWLNETDTRSFEEIKKDSGTWGNYRDNKKTTQSGGTSPASTGAIETITYKGKIYNNSPTASNNIFDLAGNVLEWTMGRYSADYRLLKGGSYSIEDSVSRSDIGHTYENSLYYGVRSMLLIK